METLHWVDIFAPQDALSSNFLKEAKAETVRAHKSKSSASVPQNACVPGLAPDVNLIYRPTDSSDKPEFTDIISFVGLRAHNLYWEHGKTSHSNAFELAIPEMFANKVLAKGAVTAS